MIAKLSKLYMLFNAHTLPGMLHSENEVAVTMLKCDSLHDRGTYLIPLCHGADLLLQEDSHPGAHPLCNVCYHLLEHWT